MGRPVDILQVLYFYLHKAEKENSRRELRMNFKKHQKVGNKRNSAHEITPVTFSPLKIQKKQYEILLQSPPSAA